MRRWIVLLLDISKGFLTTPLVILLFIQSCAFVSSRAIGSDLEKKSNRFELGVTFGQPFAAHILLGVWRPFSLPLVVRGYGATYIIASGGALEVGALLYDTPKLKHYILASIGRVVAMDADSMSYKGGKYGIKFESFFVEAGLGIQSESLDYPLRLGEHGIGKILILFNIGFGWESEKGF